MCFLTVCSLKILVDISNGKFIFRQSIANDERIPLVSFTGSCAVSFTDLFKA